MSLRDDDPETAVDYSGLERVFTTRGLSAPSETAFNMFPIDLLELINLCISNPESRELYQQLAEQYIAMLNGLCQRNEEMDLRIENLMRKYYARIAEKGELLVQIEKSEVSSKQQCEEINNLTAQLDDRNAQLDDQNAQLDDRNQTITTLTADLDRALREKGQKERQFILFHGQMLDTNKVIDEQKQVLAEKSSKCRSLKRKLDALHASPSSRSPYSTPLQSPDQDDLGSSLLCTETTLRTQRLYHDLGLDSDSDKEAAEEKPNLPLLNIDN